MVSDLRKGEKKCQDHKKEVSKAIFDKGFLIAFFYFELKEKEL